jgi:hypothetical protein
MLSIVGVPLKILIELRRLILRDAQRLPVCRSKMLGKKDDLADVVRVMSQLAIDRLHDRVHLPTNHHRAQQIFRLQAFQRFESTLPALFNSSIPQTWRFRVR